MRSLHSKGRKTSSYRRDKVSVAYNRRGGGMTVVPQPPEQISQAHLHRDYKRNLHPDSWRLVVFSVLLCAFPPTASIPRACVPPSHQTRNHPSNPSSSMSLTVVSKQRARGGGGGKQAHAKPRLQRHRHLPNAVVTTLARRWRTFAARGDCVSMRAPRVPSKSPLNSYLTLQSSSASRMNLPSLYFSLVS